MGKNIGDILGELLMSVPNSVTGAVNGMASQTVADVQNGGAIIKSLLSATPDVAGFEGMAQTYQDNAVKPKAQGFGTQPLNPYQKGVQKALTESGYAHASEALANNVTPEQILSHPSVSGQLANPEQDVIGLLAKIIASSAQANQQLSNSSAFQENTKETATGTTQDTSQGGFNNQSGFTEDQLKAVQPASTPIGKLLESVGFGTQTKKQLLENMIQLQKVQGQEPLQKGEEQKLNIQQDTERMKSLIAAKADIAKEDRKRIFDQVQKIIEIPTLSGEAATKDTLATQGLEGASNILSMMDKYGDDFIKTLSLPNSQKGQELATFVSMMKEANARLPGGATLSKNELEFANKISTPGGLKAAFTNTKYARGLLESSLRKYKKIISSVNPYKEQRDAYQRAIKEGYPQEEILDHWRKTGIIQ